MTQRKLMTPYFLSRDVEPGWYVFFQQHNGHEAKGGPFATQGECQRAIDGAEPCSVEGCKGTAFGNADADRGVAQQMAGGVPLCPEHNRMYVDEYTQEHGKPPTPVGVQ